MKIIEVVTHLLKKKLSSTMQISRGGFDTRYHLIVEVKTDAGISGLGEGVGNAFAIKGILDNYLCGRAIGLDPTDIDQVRNKIMDAHVYFERKGSGICAASAIEMACWDIKGKAMGVPVYELLGGLKQATLEAYVSDIYWEAPKKMAANAKRIVDLGFNSIKIHIGHGTPMEDAKRVEAVRDAIGKRKLMIDLNAGYDFKNALKAAELWEPYDIYWLEEPLNPNDLTGMTCLRKESKIHLAAGENEFQIYGFQELFDKKAIDFAMPDLGRAGGIQECADIWNLANKFDIPVSPHNFSSGVLLAATLHLMASRKEKSLLEFDSSKNSVYHEFFNEPLKMDGGNIGVPQQPGLGVTLKQSILNRFEVVSEVVHRTLAA